MYQLILFFSVRCFLGSDGRVAVRFELMTPMALRAVRTVREITVLVASSNDK